MAAIRTGFFNVHFVYCSFCILKLHKFVIIDFIIE